MKKIKKFIQLHKKDANKGMTMVEVLMGFTILVLMMGMLSGIIAAGNNMYMNAVDIKKEGEKLQEVIYLKGVTGGEAVENDHITFVPSSDMPGNHNEISMKANVYRIGSNALFGEENDETNELFVFFIEKPVEQSGN